MSRIEYRFALALSLAVLVPHVLVAQQTSAAQQHFAAAPESLNSIAVDAQQPPTATQPPATQPPATQPPQQTQPPQPPTGTQPTQPTTGAQPTQQPTVGGQPGAAPAAQPAVDSEGAGALLDRMQIILNAALGNRPADSQAVGTSGVLPGVDSKSKAGKVSVDRAALDEILAEVQQLRTMLRVRQ